VVVEQPDAYRFGTLRFRPGPVLAMEDRVLPRNDDHPAVARAREVPQARPFLVWSRFPFFVVEPEPGGTRVRMDDARYSAGPEPSWAHFTVRLRDRAAPGAETAAAGAP
jgi:hypothetical protein